MQRERHQDGDERRRPAAGRGHDPAEEERQRKQADEAQLRRGPPTLVAVLVAFALHAGLDWDWELPALTLTALLVAAKLLAEEQ